MSFKPLFGLFNQSKDIPLMWSPLTLEFDVVNGALDAIMGLTEQLTILMRTLQKNGKFKTLGSFVMW